jgi:ABC-2 type transport system ATP-binding protein
MAIILTTHYMDEADQLCSRIAIIDRGKIVAMDTPEGLKESLGGDLLELTTPDPKTEFLERLRALEDLKNISAQEGTVLLTVKNGESVIPKVFEMAQALSVGISSVSLRKPNLEDVFIKLTGREIRDEPVTEPKERIRIFMRTRMR